MSSPRWMRLVVGFVLGVWSVTGLALGAERGNCAKYYEPRVASLLGCCGDLELSYPGPPFLPGQTAYDRAKLAMAETTEALSRHCLVKTSPQYLSLLLDRAGARLEIAREGLADADARAISTSAKEAKAARDELRSFTRTYSHAATQGWEWISAALSQAGDPWFALEFVSQLPDGCCDAATVARVKADLFMQLSMSHEAARFYEMWLRLDSSACRPARSLANVSLLVKRGLRLGAANELANRGVPAVTCVEEADWKPYFRF